MPEEKCENCKFAIEVKRKSRFRKVHWLECHAMAPNFYHKDTQEYEWPAVNDDDWCGQFKTK